MGYYDLVLSFYDMYCGGLLNLALWRLRFCYLLLSTTQPRRGQLQTLAWIPQSVPTVVGPQKRSLRTSKT